MEVSLNTPCCRQIFSSLYHGHRLPIRRRDDGTLLHSYWLHLPVGLGCSLTRETGSEGLRLLHGWKLGGGSLSFAYLTLHIQPME